MPGQLNLPVIRNGPADAPKTRADCVNGPRPCPWVSCRQHLHAVRDRPGRRGEGRALPPPQVVAHSHVTCALDVVDVEPDGLNRQVIGKLLGLTRERIRQVEERALSRLKLATQLATHRDGACALDCPWCADLSERKADAIARTAR